jgi:hypothetical protein
MKTVQSPKVKTKKTKEPAQEAQKMPLGARRVWNKVRPMKKPTSTIKNFNDGGQRQYNVKPHQAPGVPNDPNIKRGYYDAGAKPKKFRGGGTDVEVEAHTTY